MVYSPRGEWSNLAGLRGVRSVREGLGEDEVAEGGAALPGTAPAPLQAGGRRHVGCPSISLSGDAHLHRHKQY